MAFNPKDMVWTEKYRPKKVDEIVGDFKTKIKEYLKNSDNMPHFLFYSRVPGTGKCVTKDTMFLTKNGIISFEDYVKQNNIKNINTDIKENLFDIENGFVKSSYFYKSKDKVLKLRTKRGFEIKGTKEHKIKIFDFKSGFTWKKLSEIKKGDKIPIFYNTRIFGNNNKFDYTEFNKIIDCKTAHPIEISLSKEINNDIAYLLGIIVANGTFDNNSINISTYKTWLQEKIEKIVKENFDSCVCKIKDKRKNKITAVSINKKRFKDFLITVCGCSTNTARTKYIPKIIFRCSENIQMNFLNGLFEDAHIVKEGNTEYSTASEQLAIEVQNMLLNLGFIITHRYKKAKGYNHVYHRLIISTEHSKKFIDYFGGYFKNEKIYFKSNMNTNILGYGIKFRKYISMKRHQNGLNSSFLLVKNKCIPYEMLGKSIEEFKKSIYLFLHEPYLKDLKLFKDKWIFLDDAEEIKNIGEKEIFDFHIPNTHSFLANGMINHNTTLAKCIVNELGCDSITINSSDDRGIDTIREKVKEFAKTKSTNGSRRCIFLDETDGTTRQSQDALRNIMESFASNAFFILTCNNINKISEAIRSRCVEIQFAYPNRDEIKEYLKMICSNEQLVYDDSGLDEILKYNYPSIRNCVICLQDLKTDGKAVTKENIKPINSMFEEMWEDIKKKEWKSIKTIVMESTLDARELNTYFWEKALEEENLKIIQLCCRNEKDISTGADANIIVVTSLIEMVK
jgi:DNA polymerase III delta prime subunit